MPGGTDLPDRLWGPLLRDLMSLVHGFLRTLSPLFARDRQDRQLMAVTDHGIAEK